MKQNRLDQHFTHVIDTEHAKEKATWRLIHLLSQMKMEPSRPVYPALDQRVISILEMCSLG